MNKARCPLTWSAFVLAICLFFCLLSESIDFHIWFVNRSIEFTTNGPWSAVSRFELRRRRQQQRWVLQSTSSAWIYTYVILFVLQATRRALQYIYSGQIFLFSRPAGRLGPYGYHVNYVYLSKTNPYIDFSWIIEWPDHIELFKSNYKVTVIPVLRKGKPIIRSPCSTLL